MSMDDGEAILLTKPKENVDEAGDKKPPVDSNPKDNEDRRCPRCESIPNSMISMEKGKWMCTVCAYPEKDVRRNSDKRN